MNEEKLVNFLFEIASLRRLTRSHRQAIAEVSDNISDHSFRVAIIGMILADLEKCDVNKVLKMCLFHDLAEARTGDANFVNKQYVDLYEEKARTEQMEGLPLAGEVLELLREYEKRESGESIIAKDADLIDQMILQQEYFFNDKINGTKWQEHTGQRLKTASAKGLAAKIREANPLDWIYKLRDEKNGGRTDYRK